MPHPRRWEWSSSGFRQVSFQMGSTSDRDERPVTQVQITRGFWLGKYEVAQGLWQAAMGSNPSHFDNCGSDCPVENVAWEDVQAFIRKLNQLEHGQGTGYKYRLPTEAEVGVRGAGRNERGAICVKPGVVHRRVVRK